MNRKRAWTAEEEQQLLDLAAQGLSPSRISVRLKRTTGAVEGRLYALLRSRSTPEDHGDRLDASASAPWRLFLEVFTEEPRTYQRQHVTFAAWTCEVKR